MPDVSIQTCENIVNVVVDTTKNIILDIEKGGETIGAILNADNNILVEPQNTNVTVSNIPLTPPPVNNLSGSFVPIVNEIPNDIIDGNNTTFHTSCSFIESTLSIYINGLKQEKNYYTIFSPNIIVLDSAPLIGDVVYIDYFMAS